MAFSLPFDSISVIYLFPLSSACVPLCVCPQLSTASSLGGDDDAWDASQATCCCGLCASCQAPGALCDTPFFAPSSRCSTFCTFGVRRARELCSLSRARWAAFLQSPPIVLTMATCTLLALFLDDIRSFVCVVPVSADAGFQVVILICFIIFVAEFLMQTWAIKEYRLSLFQLLDFISCLSLLPEIPWLWYAVCGRTVQLT